MGYAEFEEKEFEKPLYNQLEEGKCDVWTPGQCFEAHIGIDYSGNINSSEFWARFGGFVPKGVILNDYNMGYIWKKIKKKRILPTFRLNLFIQAKRPYVHDGEYKSVYNTKHYSFKINQRQHIILEMLEHKLRHRALLVYASPVFGTYEELYMHTLNRTMISNTSFPKISELSGHDAWYYCNAKEGIAHSEPEKMKVNNIFELIDKFKREDFDEEELNYKNNWQYEENLYFLSNTIVNMLKDNFRDDIQVEFFFSQLREMEMMYEYLQYRWIGVSYRVVTAFLTVSIFCDVFNLDWFTF